MSSPHVTARLILSPYYPGNWILLVGDRVLLAGPLDDCVAALLSIEARARADDASMPAQSRIAASTPRPGHY
jgi:hypothetical protein